MKTLFILFASISIAQELPKKEEVKFEQSLIVDYLKATSAETSSRAQYDALMEKVKKSIAESLVAQINTTIQVLIMNSRLQEVCSKAGMELDQKTLETTNEAKCIEIAKKDK
jgi:myo-inositol-1-phosphate synthase